MGHKKAVSVTLHEDNLLWLKGRAAAGGLRGVSDLLDRLVSAARRSGPAPTVRSVVGTIDLDPHDPLLEHADAAVRELFDRSLRQPTVVREPTTAYRVRARRPRRG